MGSKITIESDRPVPTFLFNSGGQWLNCPSWVEFLVDLGGALASEEFSGQHLTLAVAAPTRAFASNLIALGTVSRRSQNPGFKPSIQEHFDKISALKKGTVLQCIEKLKKYRCAFQGVEMLDGSEFVRVEMYMRNNKTARLIPKKKCQDIILSEVESEYQNKITRKKPIVERPEFTSHFVSPISTLDFALEKKTECRIIGMQNILKVEAKAEVFAVQNEDHLHTGTLNDILRIESLLPHDDPYRTLILSSRNEETFVDNLSSVHLTIFDGSNAYLKSDSSRHMSPVTVVILDKTEPNFEAATQKMSDSFIQRRSGMIKLALNHPAPQSIDILGFMEAPK